jgi:hypothetical protein
VKNIILLFLLLPALMLAQKADYPIHVAPAIPYYAWAHRGKGKIILWFPEKLTDIDLIAK